MDFVFYSKFPINSHQSCQIDRVSEKIYVKAMSKMLVTDKAVLSQMT